MSSRHLRWAACLLALTPVACGKKAKPAGPKVTVPKPAVSWNLPSAPKMSPEEIAALKAEIEKLTAQAHTEDTATREEAIRKMGALGSKATPAVRPLIDLMLDPDQHINQLASEALEKIWPDMAVAATTLMLQTSRKDVLSALDKIGGMETDGLPATPLILRVTQREYEYARAYHEPKQEPKEPPDTYKIRAAKAFEAAQKSVTVVLAGLSTLKNISADDPAMVPVLLRFARPLPNQVAFTPAKDGPPVDRIAARAIELTPNVTTSHADQAPAIVAALTAALDDPLVRYQAVQSLGEIGPQAKSAEPKLKTMKFDSSKPMRDAVFVALNAINAK
jgi:HEAT repeat protein